jgi:hypothetical protein
MRIALLWCAGCLCNAALADDAPSTAKLKVGLPSMVQLLDLMDTNRNGTVSKEEFLQFMAAEFDFADKNKDGELNPKELRSFVQGLNHPSHGPGR